MSIDLNISKCLIDLANIMIISMIIILLTGCSTSSCNLTVPAPAPISNIFDNPVSINITTTSSNINHNRMLLTNHNPTYNNNNSNYQKKRKDNYNHKPITIALNNYINSNNYNKIAYNRNYTSIKKGSYSRSTYTVKKGDTLFYIAWITGKNYLDLAKSNNIENNFLLYVGQILNINNKNYKKIIIKNLNSQPTKNSILSLSTTTSTSSKQSSDKIERYKHKQSKPQKIKLSMSTLTPSNFITESKSKLKSGIGIRLRSAEAKKRTSASLNNKTITSWCWPTKGKIIETFSEVQGQGRNKGIDIAGSRGQAILAASAGKVVYTGNALRGYGNLIIIKHNDDYLSAYAHNESILVYDQQKVYLGQQIATMGSTGTSSVRLHFEIRYKGKSVNPLHYLSKR